MFKIFTGTEKSPNLHTRSKTLSHLSLSNHDTVAASATVDGLQFDLLAPRLISSNFPPQHETVVEITEPTRTHQRTLTDLSRPNRNIQSGVTKPNTTDFLPLKSIPHCENFQSSPDQSPEPSPTRSHRPSQSTGEKPLQIRTEEKRGKLADWFKGESEPISIGILPSPTKEIADPLEIPTAFSEIRPSSLIQRSSTAQKPAMASRFSFFSSKASLAKSTPHPLDFQDDLLDTDFSATLFPKGPADASSSAAFKDLQKQAETLLIRIQTAYKERTISLREMTAEKETLAEEVEGAETRARHLKMQLDDMSVKLAEQDEAMMNLVDELAKEKLARRDEEEARKRTLRLVSQPQTPSAGDKRTSCSSTVSDSGFESEDDSSAESVFSHRNGAHSPTMSMSSVSTTSSPDTYHTVDLQYSTAAPLAARPRKPSNQTMLKGQSALSRNNIPEEITPSSCPNCQGLRASEAWGVVSVLKDENNGLKKRVGELEGALDGCLDVVGRLS